MILYFEYKALSTSCICAEKNHSDIALHIGPSVPVPFVQTKQKVRTTNEFEDSTTNRIEQLTISLYKSFIVVGVCISHS